MMNRLLTLLVVTLPLLACEPDDVELAPGLEHEPKNPYLACDPYEGWDEPLCDVGCGEVHHPDDTGHSLCGMTCDVASECFQPADGEAAPQCVGGTCHMFCDEEISCPSVLECVSGECLAPFSE